jgi:hypothetical protein
MSPLEPAITLLPWVHLRTHRVQLRLSGLRATLSTTRSTNDARSCSRSLLGAAHSQASTRDGECTLHAIPLIALIDSLLVCYACVRVVCLLRLCACGAFVTLVCVWCVRVFELVWCVCYACVRVVCLLRLCACGVFVTLVCAWCVRVFEIVCVCFVSDWSFKDCS